MEVQAADLDQGCPNPVLFEGHNPVGNLSSLAQNLFTKESGIPGERIVYLVGQKFFVD